MFGAGLKVGVGLRGSSRPVGREGEKQTGQNLIGDLGWVRRENWEGPHRFPEQPSVVEHRASSTWAGMRHAGFFLFVLNQPVEHVIGRPLQKPRS